MLSILNQGRLQSRLLAVSPTLLRSMTSSSSSSPTLVFNPLSSSTPRTFSTNHYEPVLAPGKLNLSAVRTSYAVRGELVIKSENYKKQLKENPTAFPFKEIIHCNIGNPQELGQQPLTYISQILSLLQYRELLQAAATGGDHASSLSKLFPADIVMRAQQLLANIPGGMGAYTNSQGLPIIRQQVASFIQRRDGFPSHPDNIFLTDGASPAVQMCLRLMIRGPNDGIMIPIPQYPLYSASIPLFGGSQVEYYLDEENSWGLSVAELEKGYETAKAKGVEPRALVIINPGNPTGQVLPLEDMKGVIDFCKRRRVVLLADEVYQENVYQPEIKSFHSFKKVLCSMGPGYADTVELISFHSVSKGMIGECGKRGGYLELTNIHSEVTAQLYKLASISLCPNVVGQIVMGLVVNPPKEGETSFALYKKERDDIYNSLKRRAQKLIAALNKLEGVSCNQAEGAMYAFPQITLPPRAITAAKSQGKQPDMLYASELLDETGICLVPGR
jgi:aspartate/methionine/tyrosine aminotransferase